MQGPRSFVEFIMSPDIIFIHYHRRSWSMERVLRAHSRAAGGNPLILSGESLPWLDYTAAGVTADLPAIRRDIQPFLGKGIIWFFLNHALTRSSGLSAMVDLIVRAGERIILQVHDFPEDGRPEALLRSAAWDGCWPSTAHYAVLNHRDAGILRRAGVPTEYLHWIPNEVEAPVPINPRNLHEAHYPVRGIPRKNIREFLYWAAVAPPGWHFSLSAQPEEEGLTQLARTLQIPVTWGTGYRRAGVSLTTSIREGFGFGFLEPWLIDTPVFGRDLPWLTADFRALGMEFPGLYPALVFDGMDFPSHSVVHQEEILRSRRAARTDFPSHQLIPSQNRDIVLAELGPAAHRLRVQTLLEKVRSSPPGEYTIDRQSILQAFEPGS